MTNINESRIVKLRLEQEYIYFQIDQKRATQTDYDRLRKITRLLKKLTKNN